MLNKKRYVFILLRKKTPFLTLFWFRKKTYQTFPATMRKTRGHIRLLVFNNRMVSFPHHVPRHCLQAALNQSIKLLCTVETQLDWAINH